MNTFVFRQWSMYLDQPAFVPVLIYIEWSKPDCTLQVDDAYQTLMKTAMSQLQLTARAYHRVLKLSRTIAYLAGSETITQVHLAEALQYRPKLALMKFMWVQFSHWSFLSLLNFTQRENWREWRCVSFCKPLMHGEKLCIIYM